LYDDKRKINKRRSYAESIYPIQELIPTPPVIFSLDRIEAGEEKS